MIAIAATDLSPNFHDGRRHAIDCIVIHVTEGSEAATVSWFLTHRSAVSAHYLVTLDGRIIQFVAEENEAWHAGRVDSPTAQIVKDRPAINPNAYSIGVEHEGDGKHPMPPAQEASSVALLADIAERRSIPLTRYHVIGHHEVYAPKFCPGVIDVDALVARVVSL